MRNSDTTPPRLGRVNAHLPPENMLLRFLEKVDMPSSNLYKTTSIPACEWYGVRCNDAQNVERIDWHDMNSACKAYPDVFWGGNLRGTLRWEHLPVTVLWLELYSNDLRGEVRLDALPRDLQRLNLSWNSFSGTLDFTDMPKTLTHLNFSRNYFQLALHFEHLPRGIHELFLNDNVNLQGKYNADKLPTGVIIGTGTFFIRDTKIKSVTERRGSCLIM